MTLLNSVVGIVEESIISEGMAVPKKRRSKSKGKTRLSNWKNKGKAAALKAYNAAKAVFAKEKKVIASTKNEEKVVNSSESISEIND